MSWCVRRYPDPKSGVKDLGTETDTNTNQARGQRT